MTNEEFQKLVLEQLGDLSKGQRELQHSLARIENDHGTKIAALFDGYTLRGDQTEQLQQHLDEKLDALLLNTNYLVSKSDQHDREIIGLKKLNKQLKTQHSSIAQMDWLCLYFILLYSKERSLLSLSHVGLGEG